MPSRQPVLPSEPPALTADKAIPLIQRQLERLLEIEKLSYNDPKIDAWESTTRDILDKTYGKPQGHSHKKTSEVIHAYSGPVHIGMSPGELERCHRTKVGNMRALLGAYIEQLQDGLSPIVPATPGYALHPEIEKVSGELLRDAYFKQAALEAYIRVIDQVKTKSGLPFDGDPLMNQAFGSDGRIPVLAFNSLRTDSERDEQKGIMFLFKGIVGLRNAKAHSNTLFDDPSRAHEYLALASLLMRLLEIARKPSP
jgi:uncharacterized protein (TIGR02391 family)